VPRPLSLPPAAQHKPVDVLERGVQVLPHCALRASGVSGGDRLQDSFVLSYRLMEPLLPQAFEEIDADLENVVQDGLVEVRQVAVPDCFYYPGVDLVPRGEALAQLLAIVKVNRAIPFLRGQQALSVRKRCGETSSRTLEDGADFKDLANPIDADIGNVTALAGDQDHKAIAFQLLEGLSNGGLADPEILGKQLLVQVLLRLQNVVDDPVPENLVDPASLVGRRSPRPFHLDHVLPTFLVFVSKGGPEAAGVPTAYCNC